MNYHTPVYIVKNERNILLYGEIYIPKIYYFYVRVYLDASFLISAKRTELHKYFKQVFDEIITTDKIEYEVVQKGIEFKKRDAFLTKDEIDKDELIVKKIDPKAIKTIEKVLHEGEASLIALIESFNDHILHLIGSDDRVFNRYIKYVYSYLGKAKIGVFTSLNLVVSLKTMHVIEIPKAQEILQSFEKLNLHDPDAIIEAYHDLEQK
jgi:predicted nucleic acid-binding protein